MIIRALIITITVASIAFGMSQVPQPVTQSSYIIQGASLKEVMDAVIAVDGEITHELGIINAVAATLSNEQRETLEAVDELRISHDGSVEVAGTPQPDTFYPSLVEADKLHNEGLTGQGVTVAVIDSGVWEGGWLARDQNSNWRILGHFDAQNNVFDQYGSLDQNGHGTHVSSIILSSGKTKRTKAGRLNNGLAPNAQLIDVKAFDINGSGSYADVIRGIDWIVDNAAQYNIRVINMSFSATPQSHYWDDPINQAVMRAWAAGIVVVASAGNVGPDPMTIGVPGNVPYVITVGAMSDNYTPEDQTDDFLASFSSAGPTVEGFVKPEMVAPGGHARGLMNSDHLLAQRHSVHYLGNNSFEMSGTSQSAAVVSGVVALLLEAEPHLTPDEVKCKLLSSAQPAVDANGNLAYSVFQQGAGMVNAYRARHGTNYDCANRGMDINLDITGQIHYGGRANVDEDGNYYIMGLEGYLWTDGYLWTNGFLWTDAFLWTDGFLWTDAFLWTDGSIGTNGFLWTDGFLWTNAYMWTNGFLWTNGFVGTATTETMSINSWVEQE